MISVSSVIFNKCRRIKDSLFHLGYYVKIVVISFQFVLFTSLGYQNTESGFRVIKGIPHLPALDPLAIGSPSPGMLIYSTVDKCPLIFNGTRWGNLCDNDLSTNTIEDYFAVKEGIPFLPVKNTLICIATSGSIYYSADLKSTMIFNGTDWVRISDMSDCNYTLSDNFATQGGEIKTCKLPVMDKDPASYELFEGAFYINSVSKSIRFYDGTNWKDISCIPVIETLEVSDVSDVKTISGVKIISNSGSSITIRGICWDVNPNPDISLDTKTELFSVSGFELGEFHDTLVNLMANTTYYVRAYAINCAGLAYGDEKTFKTIYGVPDIITLEVTDITCTTAVGGGNIISNGGAPILRRGICFSSKGDPIDDSEAIITNDGSGVGEFPSDFNGFDRWSKVLCTCLC